MRPWKDPFILLSLALILIVLIAVGFGCPVARADSLAADPVCRVRVDQSAGTGVVFELSQQTVFVMTNAHVVGGSQTATCEFWRLGHLSAPITGTVSLRASDVDAAVIAIPVERFEGVVPLPVPFAPRNYLLTPGQTIASAGCAKAAWVTAWRGHVRYCDAERIVFLPPPADGRSGSPLTDASGTQIVGLIRARTMDDSEGIAVPIQALYRALGREAAAKLERERLVQCGPQGCGPGGCPPGAQPPKYRVLPYRQKQEFEKQQGNLWPTLPPVVEVPKPVEPVQPPPVIAPQPVPPLPPPPPEDKSASPLLLFLVSAVAAVAGFAIYFSTNHE